jgi:hypothetical protein
MDTGGTVKFSEFLFCVALASFSIGLFYVDVLSKPDVRAAPQLRRQQKQRDTFQAVDTRDAFVTDKQAAELILSGETPNLKPCSKTKTMPCSTFTPDPVREKLDRKPQQRQGLFHEGENVTCLYGGVYSWDNGDEFVKTVGVQCKVLEATEELVEFAPGYQQVKVDCLDSLKKLLTKKSGTGMVKGHKLNLTEPWMSSTDCYHFSSGV